jgi:predicted ATPase/class 3 adenylate cyclase
VAVVQETPAVTTFLFTDIEGSTRLWEEQPERMRPALARHDAIARVAVENHRGTVVKTTGDGVHAAFGDPLDALLAVVEVQRSLAEPGATGDVALRVRCGLHVGVVERRDNDFFGSAVNRAARIMSAAHGGQVLVSQTLAELVRPRLPTDMVLRDVGLARLRDLAQPERIYQLIHPALRENFPALRSLEAVPNNLPQQLTSFIGRDRELREIRDLLRQARLVTVVGTGGLGKTRLSLQVAADALDDFPDGVWLVELAPLADPQLVPEAVASVLGVREETGLSVSQVLVRHCCDRNLLLILDNCEHLVGACAGLAATLLQSAPGVSILASSRERLNIRGETAYSLPPFVVPDPRAKSTIAELARSDGARLFIERAIAAQPSFRASATNAPWIADICYRLDGIPLAIELAAARVRAVGIETIAARLGDRFRLLTGGDRAALPRQRTLRALIDWSHDLLSVSERTLFRRLAVFAGGFSIEAAEAVTAGDELDRTDVLDVLARLVEKSLVELDAAGGRYRLLETIRDYAGERLAESGESDLLCERHLQFHLALAQTARPHLTGAYQASWLARLDAERENFLAAHAFAAHAADGGDSGLRLVSALRRYWIFRGLLGLGYRITLEALSRPQANAPTLARADALFDAGQLGSYMGEYADSARHLEESLVIARTFGENELIAAVLQPLGLSALGRGDFARAKEYLAEGLTLAESLGKPLEVAGALNALAQVARAEGDLATAEPLYERTLEHARILDNREIVAVSLLNLAMVAIGRGRDERARDMLREVLEIVDESGSRPVAQSLLEVAAGWAATNAAWTDAARLFGAAATQASETGLHRDPADEAFLAPLIAKVQGELTTPEFHTAEAAGRALSYEDAIADVRQLLGPVHMPGR